MKTFKQFIVEDQMVHKGFHPPGYDPKGCPACANHERRVRQELV